MEPDALLNVKYKWNESHPKNKTLHSTVHNNKYLACIMVFKQLQWV